MTIPSRPAPPPPNQQQQQQRQQLSQNNGGGYNNTSQTNTSLFKLPPPPTATNKLHNSKCNKSTSSSLSSLDNTSVTSITRKFPSVRTRYGSVNSMNDDPFEIVSKTVENSNVKKKTPPPRPPPPKIDLNQGTNNMALKKLGPPQSISKLSNIFGKKKNNKLPGKQQQSQQFPPNKYPPLSSNNNHTKTNQQQNFQSRPYAFVPPLVRNNYENELISFDSPPSSPTLTTLKKLNSIDSFSFSSDSNFSSSNNGSIKTQSESGFEDDFTSPPSDPWDSFNDTTYSIGYKENDLKISQPVRNLNAINSLKGDDILSNGKSLLPPPPTLTMPTIIKPKTQIPKNNNMIIKKNEAPKPPILYKEEMEKEIDDDDPPMPNCPPPPPPPEEFLNDGDGENSKFIGDDDIVDPLQPPYGIALYEFGGTEDGDLPFKVNFLFSLNSYKLKLN